MGVLLELKKYCKAMRVPLFDVFNGCSTSRHATKNNPNPLHLIKNQRPCMRSGTSYFQ